MATTSKISEQEKHHLMQFFEHDHTTMLAVKPLSAAFCDLARLLDEKLPNGPEKSVSLRKLLESRDCAVRAVWFEDP